MNKYSLRTACKDTYVNRNLFVSLVIRDIEARYRGTVLGLFWALFYPLMMLAVYTFVFGGVFKTRWGVGGGVVDFMLMLYCGLIIHALFSETLSRSPMVIVSNQSFVKKVVFPLELLPISQLVSAIFNATIGLAFMCIILVIKEYSIPLTALYIPVVLFPFVLMTAGLSWFLASIGVFFRDVGQIIGLILSVLMFLSPVFYPVSSAPAMAQKFMYINPLTYPMEELRAVLILGNEPNIALWSIYFSISVLVSTGGLWFFQKSRPAFADVL